MPAVVNVEECVGCGLCVDECPISIIVMKDSIAVVDVDECTECGTCVSACPNAAITIIEL
jgi:ferredoxin